MFSRFFVRRPVFAWVIAILIMLAGMLAIRTLPVAQYPDVAPPSIKISATYTGASAQTLENSVTQVIEQQLTGLDNLLYFTHKLINSRVNIFDCNWFTIIKSSILQFFHNPVYIFTNQLICGIRKIEFLLI